MKSRSLQAAGALLICATFFPSATSVATQEVTEGTASISGTVTTTMAPPQPLGRVLVTISGGSLKPSRTVITDDQGRFAFASLPTGSFTIVATRAPFIPTAFGARRPGRPGTPVSVTAGQHVTNVVIALSRGAAISGSIRDSSGEPAPGIKVDVTPLDTQVRPLSASVETDDRGVYRAFGLPPGKYMVTAGNTEGATSLTRLSDEEMDRILDGLRRRLAGGAVTNLSGAVTTVPRAGAPSTTLDKHIATFSHAPIHYPGTPDPYQAVIITLGEGEERSAIDIDLQLVRTVALAGHVSFGGSPLPSGTQVTLTRQVTPNVAADRSIAPLYSQQPDASGAFRFRGLLPGKYRLVARANTTAPAATPGALTVTGSFWAIADLSVGDTDIPDVSLVLRPGLRLSGTLAFDGRTAPPPDLRSVRLRLTEIDGATTMISPSTTRADGSFEISGIVPGTYVVTPLSVDPSWRLRSAVVSGRDMLDFPLEIGTSGDVTDVVVTFTDRPTELSGTLQTADQLPAPDHFVVVFSPDRAHWRLASRRVQFTRPSTNGRFAFRDLPAGEYLIAALTDLEPTDLGDVTFIASLIPAAARVQLGEGEKKTQDLRIVK